MSEIDSDDGMSKRHNESELASWMHEFKSQLEPIQRKHIITKYYISSLFSSLRTTTLQQQIQHARSEL